ncbi:MAG: YceI family protein [Rhodocyclaceae bacterium]|nr:MAG: YceI family protein [Rhodocyclaceae bacterium]
MSRLLLALLVWPLLCKYVAAAEFNVVQLDKSVVNFVSKQMGVPVEGRFKQFAAQISFDTGKPETGKAQIEIELASIDAGSSDANDEAKGKAWFNVREFPSARFVSGGIKSIGNGRYEATGKMTIKGRTRDVVAPFSAKADGGNLLIDGAIPILRLQYGIGEGAWADTGTVADEVQVRFRFTLAARK